MKRLSIICFGLILGILVGYFLPKQVKVTEIEQPEQIPVEITETVQYVEIITVEEEMEVPLPEADEIPGNTSGFIQLDVPWIRKFRNTFMNSVYITTLIIFL